MSGRGVRILVGGAAVVGAFTIVTLARVAPAEAAPRCQPTTLESLFPETRDDAPQVDTREGRTPALRDATAPCEAFVYPMAYPLAIESPRASGFGADRDGGTRKHQGVDLSVPKMTPVLAVADGEVHWIRDQVGENCCAVAIRHDDGWRSYYIHLNNDTAGTDDGLGTGLAPGIELGTRVTAGQVIGFVGDSGNAEDTISHLHFELRTPANVAVDAAASLRSARRTAVVLESSESSTLQAPALAAFSGAFRDDEMSIHAPAIDGLASVGVVTGCDETGLAFCPRTAATGETVTTWLQRSLDTAVDPAQVIDYGVDARAAERAIMQQMSAAMSTDEIRGCGDRRFCSQDPLSRGEFAALLVGVLDLGGRAGDAYVDDQGHRFEADIDVLVRDGIFDTCARPASPEFQPDRPITRADVAAFMARMLGLSDATNCSTVR